MIDISVNGKRTALVLRFSSLKDKVLYNMPVSHTHIRTLMAAELAIQTLACPSGATWG